MLFSAEGEPDPSLPFLVQYILGAVTKRVSRPARALRNLYAPPDYVQSPQKSCAVGGMSYLTKRINSSMFRYSSKDQHVLTHPCCFLYFARRYHYTYLFVPLRCVEFFPSSTEPVGRIRQRASVHVEPLRFSLSMQVSLR